MEELALILNRRRVQRGSIDFDLPEPLIEFDESGRMVGITRSERNFAHRIIEEFMLAANEAVAAYLERRGIPSLYRIHEKPDAKKVLEFEEIAATFGYSLGVEQPAAQRFRPSKRDERDRHRRVFGARRVKGTGDQPAQLPAADPAPGGQAGGAHSFLPDAAVAEAGALLGGECRPFRACGRNLYPLHIADPPLSRPDCASNSQSRARTGGRQRAGGRRCRGISRFEHKRSATETARGPRGEALCIRQKLARRCPARTLSPPRSSMPWEWKPQRPSAAPPTPNAS